MTVSNEKEIAKLMKDHELIVEQLAALGVDVPGDKTEAKYPITGQSDSSSKIPAIRIKITYVDGVEAHFEKMEDGSWRQAFAGLIATGYDAPNVLRVLANALGTREIAK